MTCNTEILNRWLDALFLCDRTKAFELLSPSFGLHDGLDAQQYVDHEISQFGQRAGIFRNRNSLRFILEPDVAGRNFVRFYAASADREAFIYEDVLCFSPEGIVGNGAKVEAVSKLRFERGFASPSRSIALRSHLGAIKNVIPMFPVSHWLLSKSETFSDDGFMYLNFKADFLEQTVEKKFRFFTEAGNFNQIVRLRGVDHPCFRILPFLEIHGHSLIVEPSLGYIWSITVKLADGSVHVFDRIEQLPISFECDIISATITDALDNDWVTQGQC